jgi:hypothetical protein
MKSHIKKIAKRPKRTGAVIGYCRQTADAAALLVPARSLPVGRIPTVIHASLQPRGR